MPRGYYLGQGLIPLGYSSSDDDEGPCELPDGRLVCGPHGLVICGRCCVDYSFMDDVRDGNKDAPPPVRIPVVASTARNNGEASNALRRGTGRVFPTKFIPPTAAVTPSALFTGRMRHMNVTRYTLPDDQGIGLIRADGACLDNGQQNPKAGWAFWHGIGPSDNLLVVSDRLEKKGPFGDNAIQTSNRAELRAVIAALRLRFWPGEGFHTLVIATDSEYVVEGATSWATSWVRSNWVKPGGGAVKNKDLWQALLGECERFKERGMDIKFWRIPRDWNTVADAAAKEAAAIGEAPKGWNDVMGTNI
ncbi:ribonuclease H-like domain-containing protein [Podospora aff. communis PSN243]|uniref:ribonuclease H n=1 Tax=Podospora aff. communis PSN243 TaxID=3040156 RepID=A0AAV9GCZ1_9PEZI|nr:ribonuclease H-like domain-containing protein [Podospora aff. communis PSN243]